MTASTGCAWRRRMDRRVRPSLPTSWKNPPATSRASGREGTPGDEQADGHLTSAVMESTAARSRELTPSGTEGGDDFADLAGDSRTGTRN